MKKLLLILLCLPMIFSCGQKKKIDEGNLDKEVTLEMIEDGYTGKGTYTWASGNKYVGEYKDGRRHGQGTFTDADGDNYVGEWTNGKKHGQGTYSYTSNAGQGGHKISREWDNLEYVGG